jgi:cell pole-organizing protein PopZ
MVADMVKPMLQKWLTDNMPRIIEKALRSEAGQPGGGGPKLPGA